MAKAFVNFLKHRIPSPLQEEQGLLVCITDVNYIREELEHIEAFLSAADVQEEKDLEVRVWLDQLREIAYDAEDILDKVVCTSRDESRVPKQIASELQSIKIRIDIVTRGNERYKSRYTPFEQGASSGGDLRLQEDVELVGLEKPKEELIRWLVSDDPEVKLCSVFGESGLGKTTLVKNVNDNATVNKHFEVRLWINVSKINDVRYGLLDIIMQLCEKIPAKSYQQIMGMSNNNLIKGIISILNEDKRYIIVVDGVWEINVWTVIKTAFPDNRCGSRIVITTSHDEIGQEPGTSVLRLKPLTQQESWILFSKKVFPNNISCPPHLLEISRKILNHCDGVPLSVLLIGGVLGSKKSVNIEEWRILLCKVTERNGKTERIQELLSLAYYDLPRYLKRCLLYLSIFPEGHIIDKTTVIRLWAAEGFLQTKEGKTKEEVGERYLNELANRNFVQVEDRFVDGRMSTCSIRGFILDLIILKGRQWNIGTIINTSDTRWPSKVRRLSIQYSMGLVLDSSLEYFLSDPRKDSIERRHGNHRFGNLRSILLFGNRVSMTRKFVFKFLKGFSTLIVLKVIDLRDSSLEKIPEGIFELVNLRYLNLSRSNVKHVPKSIGKLQNLEYLDLKNTKVKKLPIEILKLQRLEHLLANRHEPGYIRGFSAPSNIGTMVSLQKLADIKVDDSKLVREIGKLTQLRFLGVTSLRKKDGKELCSSLEKLTNLLSLSINALQQKEFIDIQYPISPTPPLLRSLQIGGPLVRIPMWIQSLHNLATLYLYQSALRENLLDSLANLPNLGELGIVGAYNGTELRFKTGSFKKLKILKLQELHGLRKLIVDELSMPKLEELQITRNKILEFPLGIEHLTKLQFLHLKDMEGELIKILENGDKKSENYCKIAHIARVLID